MLAVSLVLLGVASTGCEEEAKSPYDVAVDQRSTGLAIPDRVNRITQRVRDKEEKAKTLIAAMPTSADKVADPTDWEVVVEVVDAADAAGKDGAYGLEMREIQIAQDFFEDEKEEINKKVGGAVDYAAKQKGCEVDAWGAVSGGFKKAMEERVDERLKKYNDAFLVIERNEESLGKKNIPTLEQMAKDIAEASWTVHYVMPQAKLELESMAAAAADARAEIKRTIEEENAGPKQGAKTTPEMDKRKQERIKFAEAQLVKADQAEEAAKKNLEDLEQRSTDLKTSYDEALTKLKDALKAKKPA
ncbi:MAG: hypothetical protein HOW73_15270 [Polyangiaceae bacterium]|nr:hypothetical protein [Polyangiaceae bacterium]